MTLDLGLAPLTLTLWRDHDPAVLDQPGVAMGQLPASGDPATLVAGLYADGLRRVALNRPVDLTGGMDQQTLVWTMVLLRELTSWGIAVDWTLRLGEYAELWQRFNHLYPPAELQADADTGDQLRDWRATFYVCKCLYRRGPGFVEVRDRRAGSLSRFVVDDPAYLAAIDSLLGGVPVAEVPAGILAELVAESLAGVAGELAWWLPYRVRRWPWPSFAV